MFLYLSAPIGHRLGLLGLSLFSKTGHLGGPPPKMEAFLEGLPLLIGFRIRLFINRLHKSILRGG
jgi:hypothetical protein